MEEDMKEEKSAVATEQAAQQEMGEYLAHPPGQSWPLCDGRTKNPFAITKYPVDRPPPTSGKSLPASPMGGDRQGRPPGLTVDTKRLHGQNQLADLRGFHREISSSMSAGTMWAKERICRWISSSIPRSETHFKAFADTA